MEPIQNIRSSIKNNDLVLSGYGEYIVYRYKDEKIEEIDDRIYQQCYPLFCKMRSKEGNLQHEIEKIDPNLKVVFIPRTLYELFFIKACAKEDLKLGGICDKVSLFKMLSHSRENVRKVAKEELDTMPTCCHSGYFTNFGDDESLEIKKTALRMNNLILNKIDLSKPENLTFEKINKIADKTLLYIQKCHKNSESERSKKIGQIAKISDGGATSRLYCELNKGDDVKPIGIANDRMVQMIRNAITIECSERAKENLILYRGSIAKNDSPVSGSGNSPYSLSYGTSLFAGIMYDSGASAFAFMREKDASNGNTMYSDKNDNDAFAILIPKSSYKISPFAIPTTHPLCQLQGAKEYFHARTKAWLKDLPDNASMGCSSESMGKISALPLHYKIDITKEELLKSFEDYMKNNTISLNT